MCVWLWLCECLTVAGCESVCLLHWSWRCTVTGQKQHSVVSRRSAPPVTNQLCHGEAVSLFSRFHPGSAEDQTHAGCLWITLLAASWRSPSPHCIYVINSQTSVPSVLDTP